MSVTIDKNSLANYTECQICNNFTFSGRKNSDQIQIYTFLTDTSVYRACNVCIIGHIREVNKCD